MLLPGINLSDEPRRNQICEANRAEDEFWVSKLRLIRKLCCVYLVLFRLQALSILV